MKHHGKRICSAALSAALLLSAAGIVGAGASEKSTVRVVVRNDTFAQADGAAWSGVLIDGEITLNDADSVESVLERAITDNGYEFTVSNFGYISSVNGLGEYAANGSGGWMAALNDWFTSDGTGAYTVENGGLQAGDEIVMRYTCSWGGDVGSLYGNYDTSLKALTVSGGGLLEKFSPEEHEYSMMIDAASSEVSVVPEAFNKNYQVRMYRNDYQPEEKGIAYRSVFSVNEGDKLVIGVGNPAWPTMNSWGGTAEETLYTLTVKKSVAGDVDGNGVVDIQDVTLIQRYLADFTEFSEYQLSMADYKRDGVLNINDATEIQRLLVMA